MLVTSAAAESATEISQPSGMHTHFGNVLSHTSRSAYITQGGTQKTDLNRYPKLRMCV